MSTLIKYLHSNQPEDENITLWRYMDETKFFDLIETKSLYLRRADKFDDNFEGTIPIANYNFLKEIEKTIPNISSLDKIHRISTTKTREWIYINCWHMNYNESDAMWKLYSKSDNSIAITTSYSKIKQLLPHDTFIGLVRYSDYNKEYFDNNDIFYPFFQKRNEFKHENEVRILRADEMVYTNSFLNKDIEKNKKDYCRVYLNTLELIDSIYLSPKSSKEFQNLIFDYCKKNNLNFEVKTSTLNESPFL